MKRPSQSTRVALGSGVPPILHRRSSWHLLMESPTLCISSYPPSFELPRTVTGTWSCLHGWCLACGHTPSYGHKSWNQPIVHQLFDSLLAHCTDQFSQSHLLGACSSESGAWLNAPPVSSLGLRMSDDVVRTAIGLKVVPPYVCPTHVTCVENLLMNLDTLA